MNQHSHQQERSQQLVHLQRARHDLARANTVAEITAVRRKAESVRSHAQQASLGIEIQNYAAELKLQAERLAGRFLAEMKLRGGDRKSRLAMDGLKLKDLGIDKNQSARWQMEAMVPEIIFRDFVRGLHAAGREISSAALLRLAKSLREGTVDELLVRLPNEVPAVSTQSHLLNVNWQTVERPGRDIDEITELVTEIRNHHKLLTNVVHSICQRAALDPTSTDYRAIQRYLAEIDIHLRKIASGLQRLGHAAAAAGDSIVRI
jgi:hypothetical protein